MKRTIPEIRELISALTEESKTLARRQLYIATKINALAQETHRRTFKRAPITSTRVTAAVRKSVRDMVAANPDMPHQEVAERHNINIGRVSEIVHGHRA